MAIVKNNVILFLKLDSNSTQTPHTTNTPQSSHSKLGFRDVIGIVIGIVLALSGTASILVWIRYRRHKGRKFGEVYTTAAQPFISHDNAQSMFLSSGLDSSSGAIGVSPLINPNSNQIRAIDDHSQISESQEPASLQRGDETIQERSNNNEPSDVFQRVERVLELLQHFELEPPPRYEQ
jgi:hypothetical protein